MNNGRKNMNANTQKTSENNASPSPAPVRQSQNKLRLMAEKSGFDCDEIVANINAWLACNPDAEQWKAKEAIFSIAITAKRLGLSLAPAMGHAYILKGRAGPELVIGYQGLLKLAYETGRVKQASAEVVRKGETFKVRKTQNGHEYEWESNAEACEDPGPIVAAFAEIEIADAKPIFLLLRMDSVLALRERKGPMWQREPEQMVRKTALARALRLVPGLDEKLGELAGEGDDA